MNHAHHDMDEMGRFSEKLHRARYCSGNGCTQGRTPDACNCPTGPGEACSELLEDQSDSADRDVVMFLLKLILALAAFNAVVYSLVHYFQA